MELSVNKPLAGATVYKPKKKWVYLLILERYDYPPNDKSLQASIPLFAYCGTETGKAAAVSEAYRKAGDLSAKYSTAENRGELCELSTNNSHRVWVHWPNESHAERFVWVIRKVESHN